MRLNASKIGLFAGLLGVVTGQGAAPSGGTGVTPLALIDFGDTFTPPAVFVQTEVAVAEIIWATVTYFNLTVTDVYLYQRGNRDGEDDTLIAESNVATDFYLFGQNNGRDIERLVRRVLTLQTFFGFADGRYRTQIPLNAEPDPFSNVWNHHALYMEFRLRNDTHTGNSYSPPFVVISNGTLRATADQILRDEPNPVKLDEVHWIATTTDVSAGTSAPPTSSPIAGSPSLGTGLNTASPAAEDSSGQSQAGLSPGAIAGIAVGIGVGFLAVAGLSVWFCLRRRRSGRPLARAREVGYGSDSGAVAMMPEKEAAGLTESSSHPVYDHHSAPVAHHSTPVAHHDDPTAAADSYAPYSDHLVAPGTAVTTPTPTSLNEPSPVPHEQQQQGPGGETDTVRQHQQQPITSRYAHLVEEGMTEEEIRRLEEEERQLDAAIEQAGRRHSQTRQ
ncbi:hypothetical protein DL770_002351 [Monosporascus sp. CRB-9-2]|nr:hypothetical protein DL770_002351 [Monosporascus sp. CRB-9-2]